MKRLLPLLLCLLTLPACHAADWYPGIIHLHTQFSDGLTPPAGLATACSLAGAKFIIVTDHYDEIGTGMKLVTPLSLSLGAITLNEGGSWGFPKYCEEVSRLTRDGEFVAIPGAEIGAKWDPEPGNEASAHTLALGVIRELDGQMADQYCEKSGRQQDVINKIREWGVLPVAAHPSFLHDGRSGGLSLVGRVDYRYDKRPADQAPEGQVQYKGLAGVEIWNVDKAEQQQEDIDFYMRLIREGYRPFVTTGSDYHGYKPWESATFAHKTWVYADDLTTGGILKAISAGRTYAAQYGARFTQLSPLPGETTAMDRAVIRATVRFDNPTTSEKRFRVYRDGQLAYESDPQPARRTTYSFDWSDAKARQGDHSYVLAVGDVLVTSPMPVRVTKQPTDFMAFVRNGNIWLMDLDAKAQRQVTTTGDCSSPSWSPDGTRLVYLRRTPSRKESLWVLDTTVGNAVPLTGDLSECISPCWSPDGEWVAYFSRDDDVRIVTEYTPSRLVKINLRTKAATVLLKGIWGAMGLAWSPNSSELAYAKGTEGIVSISVVAPSDGHAIPRDLYRREFDGLDVGIKSVSWPQPDRIVFCLDGWDETRKLTIRQVTLAGLVSTVREFPDAAGDTTWPFGVAAIDGRPWIVSWQSALWLLQDGQMTKMVDDADGGVLAK